MESEVGVRWSPSHLNKWVSPERPPSFPGYSFPHLSNPGIKPTSPETPALQADSFLLSHLGYSPRGLKRAGLDIETKQNRVLRTIPGQ